MDQPARVEGSDAHRAKSLPVPTAGQVVARTLPAVAVIVVGFLLLAWLVTNFAGEVLTSSWPWAVMAWSGLIVISLGLARRPWPRLEKSADQVSLKRAHALASESGKLPNDPSQRSAAGALAWRRVVAAISATSFALGSVLAVVVRPVLPWWVLVVLAVVLAVFHLVRARPSWRYLQRLHAPARTG
jgi:hypothetical protein